MVRPGCRVTLLGDDPSGPGLVPEAESAPAAGSGTHIAALYRLGARRAKEGRSGVGAAHAEDSGSFRSDEAHRCLVVVQEGAGAPAHLVLRLGTAPWVCSMDATGSVGVVGSRHGLFFLEAGKVLKLLRLMTGAAVVDLSPSLPLACRPGLASPPPHDAVPCHHLPNSVVPEGDEAAACACWPASRGPPVAILVTAGGRIVFCSGPADSAGGAKRGPAPPRRSRVAVSVETEVRGSPALRAAVEARDAPTEWTRVLSLWHEGDDAAWELVLERKRPESRRLHSLFTQLASITASAEATGGAGAFAAVRADVLADRFRPRRVRRRTASPAAAAPSSVPAAGRDPAPRRVTGASTAAGGRSYRSGRQRGERGRTGPPAAEASASAGPPLPLTAAVDASVAACNWAEAAAACERGGAVRESLRFRLEAACAAHGARGPVTVPGGGDAAVPPSVRPAVAAAAAAAVRDHGAAVRRAGGGALDEAAAAEAVAWWLGAGLPVAPLEEALSALGSAALAAVAAPALRGRGFSAPFLVAAARARAVLGQGRGKAGRRGSRLGGGALAPGTRPLAAVAAAVDAEVASAPPLSFVVPPRKPGHAGEEEEGAVGAAADVHTVFTCGHRYSGDAEWHRTLTRFQERLASALPACEHTRSALAAAFSRPSVAAACPACVLRHVQEEVARLDEEQAARAEGQQ